MLSRVVQKKQPRRRLLTTLAAVGLVAGTLLASGTALAIHDAGRHQPRAGRQRRGQPGWPPDDWNNFCPDRAGQYLDLRDDRDHHRP